MSGTRPQVPRRAARAHVSGSEAQRAPPPQFGVPGSLREAPGPLALTQVDAGVLGMKRACQRRAALSYFTGSWSASPRTPNFSVRRDARRPGRIDEAVIARIVVWVGGAGYGGRHTRDRRRLVTTRRLRLLCRHKTSVPRRSAQNLTALEEL
jgi:hypothetical protein